MSSSHQHRHQPSFDSDAASAYTMGTVSRPASPLLPSNTTTTSYGATAVSPRTRRFSLRFKWGLGLTSSQRKPLVNAAVRFSAIFVVSSLLLGGTLWLALPTVEEEDRQYLHIPKSFAQLQELNTLLKKYRDIYPYRIVVCYVIVYLFLQAFSLPGSMYLSILAGAVWGMPRAIILACTCVASGATLCYLLSAAFGPALLTLPSWSARLDRWSEKVEAQRSNIYSFMIVLRIAPFPPHWVVNVLCPHLRIGIVPFWISTWLGIVGVTIIHTAIGGGLDQMTSADDFHLISWRNFALLAAIAFAVLIPVGLRYVFNKNATGVVLDGADDALLREEDRDADVLSVASDEFGTGHKFKHPRPEEQNGKARSLTPVYLIDAEMDEPDSDADVALLATGGPERYKPGPDENT